MIEFTEGDRKRLESAADFMLEVARHTGSPAIYETADVVSGYLRKLAERAAGDAEDTVSRESAKLVADDAYRTKLAYERVCNELAASRDEVARQQRRADGECDRANAAEELREWLTSDEAAQVAARVLHYYQVEGQEDWADCGGERRRRAIEDARRALAAVAEHPTMEGEERS